MKLVRIMLAASMAFMSTSSFAFIDVQAMVGKRWGEFGEGESKNTASGNEVVVAAHIAPLPIPMVTLGFGPAISYTAWNAKDFGAGVDKVTNLDLGLEALVAFDIPFLFEPYVKLNYTFMSNGLIEASGDSIKSKGNGTALSLGIRSSIIPLLSLLAEGKMYSGKLKFDSVAGAAEESDETDLNSKSFLVGLELGF